MVQATYHPSLLWPSFSTIDVALEIANACNTLSALLPGKFLLSAECMSSCSQEAGDEMVDNLVRLSSPLIAVQEGRLSQSHF